MMSFRRRTHREQPARCSCMHTTETATWDGKRRSGAGLTGRGAARHLADCMHSELALTTKRAPKRKKIARLTL